MQVAQRTSEWLAGQIEETKSKVQEAEERLRDFVQASGNVFAGQDVTLEDTKLLQLKGELAKIQSERIGRQTRYELTLHNPPESLGEILDNGVLRGYQAQLEELKREKAALETIYTSKHEKVRKIDAQIALIEKTYAASSPALPNGETAAPAGRRTVRSSRRASGTHPATRGRTRRRPKRRNRGR